jgi:FkbM family methyltransferase
MIANTRRLFLKLLPSLDIDVVCDVGSMDGADALTFRKAVPHSRIYAFEPNPINLELMNASAALQRADIEVVPLAATNYDGEADFFVVEADYARADGRRGMSSLHRRGENPWTVTSAVVRVRTRRMESFLAGKCSPRARIALWIDTEGKAYEVLEGIAGIADCVQLVHVEVETTPCIGTGQKLYPEVKSLLQQLGFSEVAIDQSRSQMQFNALFARTRLSAWMRIALHARTLQAGLRYRLSRIALAVCPACLARYQTIRAQIQSSRTRDSASA